MKLRMKASFSAAVKESTLELLVYDVIGEDFWTGGGVTAKSVAEQIRTAGQFDNIRVRINSPGGDAFEGAAIYNLLRAQGKPIEVCIDGVAASAASSIAMAGDTRLIGANAMIMIHNAWSVCAGDARDMLKMADTLAKVSTSLAQVYVERTGQSAEAVQAMMDEETWLSAQDCIDKGFATGMLHQDDEESAQASMLAAQFRMEKIAKTVPEAFRANANQNDNGCDCPCEACEADDCENCSNPDCDDPDCIDCPQQQDPEASSNLSLYEARLKLVTQKV
jgi:ATP-dependent Clp protease protease subunit